MNFSSGFYASYVHGSKIYKTGGKLSFLLFFVSRIRKSNLSLYPGENTEIITHNWYVVLNIDITIASEQWLKFHDRDVYFCFQKLNDRLSVRVQK